MDRHESLADQFEKNRAHLRAVAYRVLGSLTEADDAVQEAWLRLSRSDSSGIDNLGGWLTTVVARVSLDMLRSRKARAEDSLDAPVVERKAGPQAGPDPEQETLLANSVGLALLVILDTLAPAERLAFVLHDMFAMPFDEIAPIVGRSPEAARQLASRARRRVQGSPAPADSNVARQREVVDAFLAAARGGNLEGLLAILDPDVVLRTDSAAMRLGATALRGAAVVAERAARAGARAAQPALINGAVGIVVAPRGKLRMVLAFTIHDDKIVDIEAIADPERLKAMELHAI
ncbi:MAG TPA: sigma-70 family RNA polymerase sigma factor [Vicinamibacterales bacterium]|jgi:RNA polymerase sigma-70 factor (ECF subfamily)